MNQTTQYCRVKLNVLTAQVVHWQYTEHAVRQFQFDVFLLIAHPVRPRTLLQGVATPEDMITEFISASVLR